MTLADGRSAQLRPLEETTHLLWAVGHAPQLVLAPGWCLDVRQDRWQLVTENGRPARSALQPTLVGAGAAIEHAVLALQARGLRVAVRLLPEDDPAVLACLDLIGTGPASDLALVPGPRTVRPHVGDVRPSELRQLNLAAEAFAVEILWSTRLAAPHSMQGLQRVHASTDNRPMATLVTHDDRPQDQLRAGRALAHVLLRAAALGLDAQLCLHVLGQREVRDELRGLWTLREHPQVQFTLTDPEDHTEDV